MGFIDNTVKWLGEKVTDPTPPGEKQKNGNKVSFKKLDKFIERPRELEGEFKEIIGTPPLFGIIGKPEWESALKNAPLIYASVVQANNALYEPGNEMYLPAVLLFAEDEAHQRNIDWLKETTAKIHEMEESEDVPPEAEIFISALNDEDDGFCIRLPECLSDGAKAWCVVYKFARQTDLPNTYLPRDNIVPIFLKSAEYAYADGLILIPAKYYM